MSYNFEDMLLKNGFPKKVDCTNNKCNNLKLLIYFESTLISDHYKKIFAKKGTFKMQRNITIKSSDAKAI